jgi:hypothetical protein
MVLDEQLQKRWQDDYETHSRVLAALPGGASLIELYGRAPSFHDSEVQSIQLSIKGQSLIRVRNLYPDIFSQGHVIVSLSIAEIIDIELDGFSPQNVLDGLRILPAPEKPERQKFYPPTLAGDDLEIELESIYGLGGSITCRGISIGWTMDRRTRRAARVAATAKPLLGQ